MFLLGNGRLDTITKGGLKGIVNTKMKTRSSFTHPHAKEFWLPFFCVYNGSQ